MNDISNKTLAVLVIIAIIVSLVGLYLGRIRLVTVGEATDAGPVTADVASNIIIDVEYGIDFTQGSPAAMVYGENRNSDGGAADCGTDCWVLVASVGLTPVDISYLANLNLWYWTADGSTRIVPDRQHESTGFQIKAEESDGVSTNFITVDNAALCIPPVTTTIATIDSCLGTLEAGMGTYGPVDVQFVGADNTLIIQDCSQCQGFRVGVDLTVPPANEDPGSRTTVVTFSAVQT